jgi:hypothetical protein
VLFGLRYGHTTAWPARVHYSGVKYLRDVVEENSIRGKYQKWTLQRKTNLQWRHLVNILELNNNRLADFAVPSPEEYEEKMKNEPILFTVIQWTCIDSSQDVADSGESDHTCCIFAYVRNENGPHQTPSCQKWRTWRWASTWCRNEWRLIMLLKVRLSTKITAPHFWPVNTLEKELLIRVFNSGYFFV